MGQRDLNGAELIGAIIDSSPIPQFIINPDHKVIFWNKALEKYTGISASEILGTDKHRTVLYHEERPLMADLLVDHDLEGLHRWYKNKFRKSPYVENAFEADDFFPDVGENGIWLYFTAAEIKDDEGNIIGVLETLEDITQRKNMELKLRHSEDEWEFTFNALTDPIAIIDVDHNIKKVNKAMAKGLNRESPDLVGVKCYSVVHGTSEPPSFCPHVHLINDQRPHTSEFFIDRLHGDYSVSVSPIIDDDGQLRGSIHVAHDVTKRRQMEIALKESEEKFREVFNNANDMISLNLMKEDGLPGKFMEVNQVGQERLGYSRDEFLLMSPADIVAPDFRDKMPENAKNLNKHGYANFEITHVTKDGKRIPVEISNHLFHLQGQEVAIAVTRDISERKKVENAVVESEKKYRTLFENMLEGFAYCKMLFNGEGQPCDWVYIDVNHAFYKLTGLKNIEGKKVTEAIPGIIEAQPELFEIYGRVAVTGVPETIEIYFKPLKIWLNISVFSPARDYFVAVFENITKRKNAEMALKESEKKYRLISENSGDVIWMMDLDSQMFSYVSPSVHKLRGFTAEEVLKQSLEDVLTTESYQYIMERLPLKIQAFLSGDESVRMQTFRVDQVCKDGSTVPTEAVTNIMTDDEGNITGVLAVSRDITQRLEMEEEIQQSLQEKEMLLKEIHHRVKNNLMIISSLLNLQSRYIKDKEALSIFKESQSRANSMALIHERLYRSDDLKRINFGDYIRKLSNDLFRTYVADNGRIKLNIDVEDVMMDINTSIPLGLILNELVSNALKHAFPGDMGGEINVVFKSSGDDYQLTVSDNGIGLPADLDYKNTDSLGMQLVNNLTGQIDGNLELDATNGTKFSIIFKERKYGK
ncbi:PAS domain S-box protein [Methanobacterium formicicum]|uniref:Signal transduction histidine kinase n=1 Tax=Methanobacterium formicicum (strain DSM 3637 / PP1) TaxID=1204725 RepID=K2R434_METFP|nr:PAS domain S-box protein [Methanobacterium formicicum]EKF85967.1 signal transduction histidine kinase [Methanobacterium formicicum DSM 3637]